MASFVAAYSIVWAFTALYVFRLRTAHHRNLRRLHALERLVDERRDKSDKVAA